MEALIVSLFALMAIILLEAGYWIGAALARWSPVLLIGTMVGWLAACQGADHLGALGSGVLTCLVCRWALARLFDRARS